MSELDQMLNPPAEVLLPPLVRYWSGRLKAGDRLAVEVQQASELGGLSRTGLVVRRWEDGREQAPEGMEWDDELNAELIGLGVRAGNVAQEAVRFSLRLRAALRKVERQYGDGFLNAVLVDLIDESDLGRNGAIAEVRKAIRVHRPERGTNYARCRELIANEIGGRAAELRDRLKYRPEEVKAIMEKALALYVDERFSVSSRQQAGLL